MVLGVQNMSTADGGLVIQWGDTGTADHLWTAVVDTGGYFRLRNSNSGKVLGVENAGTANGARVVQWADNGTADHRWRLRYGGNGYFRIQCANGGRVLGVSGASTAQGAQVVLGRHRLERSPLAVPLGPAGTEDTHRPVPCPSLACTHPWRIDSALPPEMAPSDGRAGRRSHLPLGHVPARHRHHECRQRGDRRHQRLVRAGQPQQRQGHGRVQLRHRPTAAASRQWTRSNGNNQQWQFVDSGGGYYRIKSRHSGKVLDVSDFSTADGGAVVQWTDLNGTNQQWRLADSDGGYVRLINRNSGKALEVQGASTADGGNIVQYADWGGTNQQWQLVRGRRRTDPDAHADPAGRRQYSNPVVWQDFADGDIIRVGDAYYYSASTMHYSPGAPILRSYDLVNWEYAGHSVPRLDFGSNAYDLNGGRAYVKGIWASTLNYRPSNSTYYWIGCVEFNRTYVYTASAVDGTWTKRSQINNCYYDAGLLVDDNDTMYVAYGNTHHQRRPAVRRRAQPGPHPAGVHRRRPASAPWRAPASTSATAATTSG